MLWQFILNTFLIFHLYVNVTKIIFYSLGVKLKNMFIIDLNKKNIKVEDYLAEDIEYDLKHFKLKDPLKLSNNDFKVFNTAKEALGWLDKYTKILNSLDNSKICKSRDLPAILLKRKYMVQALMGEKMQTYRKYKKHYSRKYKK